MLERADKETFQSYTNEIELLRRLKGHDRIIQLVDHQISFTPSNKPKILNMVRVDTRKTANSQVMECGEIDFSSLLEEQRGQPLNLNFVGLYWQQVSYSGRFVVDIRCSKRSRPSTLRMSSTPT